MKNLILIVKEKNKFNHKKKNNIFFSFIYFTLKNNFDHFYFIN
jgi:hypothetical protein